MRFVSPTNTSITVARRVSSFSYAIRNIVVEAQRVEAAGKKVRYLNVGNPPAFGFDPPAHMIAAVERAMHDRHNGYGPSPGIMPAREAVASEYTGRGWKVSADRVFLTAGTSEGIELVLSAIVDTDDEVLVPMPTYPLYTAVIGKIGARARYYRTDPSRGWIPDLDHLSSLVTPATRALVVIDPNNPTGATYPAPVRRALVEFSERHGLALLADEVYGDIAFDGPVPPMGSNRSGRRRHLVLQPVEGLSGAGLAHGMAGLRSLAAAGRSREGHRQTGRRPAVQHRPDAVRGGRRAAGRPIASGRVPRRARGAGGDHGVEPQRHPRHHVRAADGGLLRHAARSRCRRARPTRTTCSGLLRATGVLCVYGSGFGTPAEDGYLRIVFLASPDELREIYGLMADFTKGFLG